MQEIRTLKNTLWNTMAANMRTCILFCIIYPVWSNPCEGASSSLAWSFNLSPSILTASFRLLWELLSAALPHHFHILRPKRSLSSLFFFLFFLLFFRSDLRSFSRISQFWCHKNPRNKNLRGKKVCEIFWRSLRVTICYHRDNFLKNEKIDFKFVIRC